MSVITAKGKQVKENINQKKIDFKKVNIWLKEGESVRVRILGVEDYVEYKAHGSFSHGIYTQPCTEPAGDKCALCIAAKAEEEGFDVLSAKKRYLFAFADIDSGDLRVFDASKTQAKKLIAQIEEYAEDIDSVAFNFKRTGKGKDTDYSLNPILKLKADDKTRFEAFENQKVELSFFESILRPKTNEYQVKILREAGFPIEKHFDANLVSLVKGEEELELISENTEVDELDII